MLVDKTNFGLGFYNHTNFYRSEKTSSNWSFKRISDFLCFSLVIQRHTSGITVYNRTVTNIENTMRAVHSCNSWFSGVIHQRNIHTMFMTKCVGRSVSKREHPFANSCLRPWKMKHFPEGSSLSRKYLFYLLRANPNLGKKKEKKQKTKTLEW